MKKVYYKGNPYEFQTIETHSGRRQFQLFQNNALVHFVEESELDKKTQVSMILNAYYENMARAV
jgi:hypothetical protein